MESFLSQSRAISRNIETLREYTEKLKYLSDTKNRSVLKDAEEHSLNSQIKALNQMFKELSSKIKQELKEIGDENEKIRAKTPSNTFLVETRNSHWQSLMKKLSEVVNAYKDIQVSHSDAEKQRLINHYMIARPNATEQEIEDLLSAEKGEMVLQSAFALGSHSAQQLLSRAEARNENIQNILKNVEELCELIEEIHGLVKESNIMVDNIHDTIASARVSVEEGNKNLIEARKYQRRAMRFKRIIYMILGVCFFLLVLYICIKIASLFNLGSKGKKS